MGVGKVKIGVIFAALQFNSRCIPFLPPVGEAISLACWGNGGIQGEGEGGGVVEVWERKEFKLRRAGPVWS